MSPSALRPLTSVLLLLVAFNHLPGIYFRPLWATIFAAVLLGYRTWLHLVDGRMPPRWVKWLAQGAVLIAIWQHYNTVLGDEASGTLLSLLVVLKTYELRTKRDFFITALLCLLVLMSFLLLDQSLTLTAFLFLDALALIAYLLALEEEKWIWSEWRGLFRSAWVLALKALPLMVLIFVLFPRFTTGFGGGARPAAKTGITDQLRPGSIADLVRSDELVFRATFLDGEVPSRRQLYWRGAVLDVSNGMNWDRSPGKADRRPPAPVQQNGEIEIYLEPGFERFLFSLDDTRTLIFPNEQNQRGLQAREGEIVDLERPLQVRERYFLQRLALRTSPKYGDKEPDLSPYLQVAEAPSSRLKAFLAPLRGLPTGQVVASLMRHFSSQGYAYTLEPSTVDSMDEFLFDAKKGFCEHYAGSMATMLRHLKIPSRVVVGFQGGSSSFLSNYITVRAHDAHSWVEYFDHEGKRWRRVDPTMQVAPLRISQGSESLLQGAQEWLPSWLPVDVSSFYARSRAVFDEIEASWIGFLVRFDLARQKEFLARLGMEGVLFRALPVFLLLSLALFLAVVYFLETRRQEPLSSEERIYRQLLDRLRRWRIEKSAAEGPLTLLLRIEREYPDLRTQIRPVFEALILARFGGQPLS
ncbi:MAG: DUF3488 and DUF4129 domain-containing transglutaminase family protein, partial [Bdellovibrionales bacterium]